MDTRKKIRILKGIDVKKLYKLFATLIFSMLFCTTRAFAAGTDPLAAINNLSTFVFAAIKAVGVIILGWGVLCRSAWACRGMIPHRKVMAFCPSSVG